MSYIKLSATDKGPKLFRTGKSVVKPAIDMESSRWPVFLSSTKVMLVNSRGVSTKEGVNYFIQRMKALETYGEGNVLIRMNTAIGLREILLGTATPNDADTVKLITKFLDFCKFLTSDDSEQKHFTGFEAKALAEIVEKGA